MAAEAKPSATGRSEGAIRMDGSLELRDVTLRLRVQPSTTSYPSSQSTSDTDPGALVGPLSLCVAPGEVATIMGPSGAGKSSLLSFICGAIGSNDPAFRVRGQVILGGRDITREPLETRRVGILFQDDLLFPHMSVAENLLFALPRSIHDRAARRELALSALRDAGLDDLGDRRPHTLSGGQRARVAVMRTLLAAPEALLLDEPFSKLDADTRDSFRAFVFSHARARELPTLLVTHDPEDARAAGGRVLQI